MTSGIKHFLRILIVPNKQAFCLKWGNLHDDVSNEYDDYYLLIC